MEDKLVTIAEFSDYIEADLARQVLEDFGIKAFLVGDHAANVYAGMTSIAAAQLQTLESQAEKAIDILRSQKEQEQ